MHISRVEIKNFRNLVDFKVDLAEKAIVLGENGAGKTNFFEALRIALDPSYRVMLSASDFSRGTPAYLGAKIEVHLWFSGFDPANDIDLLACAHDCRISPETEPLQIKLSCVYQPRQNIQPAEATGEDEYELIRYGGDDPSNLHSATRFRSYVRLFLIPALRDIDRDMQSWRLSPMRRLLELMSLAQDSDFLKVAQKVADAGNDLQKIQPISQLQSQIRTLLSDIIDDASTVNPTIGLLPSDPDAIQRLLTLFIETDLPLERASLGLSNVLYLTIQLVFFDMLRTHKKSSQSSHYTILAIEEPEAHLHPHLQRLVFSNVFKRNLSLLVSTHSSTIVSIAKPEWFVLFKPNGAGITAVSTSQIRRLDEKIRQDLSRFLDATRGEVVFSRAVILVEGDAEMFLVPEMARRLKAAGLLKRTLDGAGITVCNVYGTDFAPYIHFLGPQGLNLPIAIITDGDLYVGLGDKAQQLQKEPSLDQATKERLLLLKAQNVRDELRALLEQCGHGHYEGLKRGIALTRLVAIDQVIALQTHYDNGNWETVRTILEEHGIFVNQRTLEDELIAVGYKPELVEVYRDLGGSQTQQDNLCADLDNGEIDKVIRRIETTGMGKGRFAQRLAERLDSNKIPPYIAQAIHYVMAKVPKPIEIDDMIFPSAPEATTGISETV